MSSSRPSVRTPARNPSSMDGCEWVARRRPAQETDLTLEGVAHVSLECRERTGRKEKGASARLEGRPLPSGEFSRPARPPGTFSSFFMPRPLLWSLIQPLPRRSRLPEKASISSSATSRWSPFAGASSDACGGARRCEASETALSKSSFMRPIGIFSPPSSTPALLSKAGNDLAAAFAVPASTMRSLASPAVALATPPGGGQGGGREITHRAHYDGAPDGGELQDRLPTRHNVWHAPSGSEVATLDVFVLSCMQSLCRSSEAPCEPFSQRGPLRERRWSKGAQASEPRSAITCAHGLSL